MDNGKCKKFLYFPLSVFHFPLISSVLICGFNAYGFAYHRNISLNSGRIVARRASVQFRAPDGLPDALRLV